MFIFLTYDTGFLELFLLHEDKSLEFKNKMEEIRSTVETDYHGDSTFKDVEILVSQTIFGVSMSVCVLNLYVSNFLEVSIQFCPS